MPRIPGTKSTKSYSAAPTLYALNADLYVERGFDPIAIAGKSKPSANVTGYQGQVTPAAIERMKQESDRPNLAIRHRGTLSIDVDEGDGKHGMATLTQLIQLLGDPGKTYSSTARGQNDPRRQYMFRIADEHLELVSKLLPGMRIGGGVLTTGDIEIPQWWHRFSAVWPTVHPDTGEAYTWYDLDGQPMDGPPRVEDLPFLPERWVDALRKSVVTRTAHGAPGGRLSLAELLEGPPKRDEGNTNDWLTAVAGHLAIRHRGDFDTYATEVKRAIALVDPDYEDIEKVTNSVWKTDRMNHPGQGPLHSWDTIVGEPDESAFEPTVSQHSILEGTEDFWSARPVLSHIFQAAQNRLVSPFAVLAGAVVQVLAAVPPHVYLPPIVGGRASLNTFVCLVAPSGGGKDAAGAVVRELFVVHSDTPVKRDMLGSGEGLTKAYAHRDKGELVMDHTNVLFTVSEIDNLTALSSRQGSTLMGSLRAGWSGSDLGFGYADPTKKVTLEEGTYRMCLVVFAQPGRAASLFDDAEGGTPQRFVWLPAFGGLGIKSVADRPTWPGQIEIALPWALEDEMTAPVVELSVPKVAEDLVVQTRFEMVSNGSTSLNGHALLARLKFAYGLTLLDRRDVMNDEDWELSGRIMQVSDRLRDWMQAQVEQSQRTEAVKRGELRGAMNEAAQAVTDTVRIKRIKDGLVKRLETKGPMSRADLRRSLRGPDRPLFDRVIENLIQGGDVVVEEAAHGGSRYVLRGSK